MHYEFLCTHLFTMQLTLCIPILLFVFFSGVTFKTLLFVCCGCEYIAVEYRTPHISTLSFLFFFLCSATLPKDSDHQLSIEYPVPLTVVACIPPLFCDKSCHRGKSKNKPKKQKSKTNKRNEQTKIKAKQKQKTSLKLLTLSDKYVLSFQEMRLTSQY